MDWPKCCTCTITNSVRNEGCFVFIINYGNNSKSINDETMNIKDKCMQDLS